MRNATKRAEGAAEELGGKLKSAAGKLIKNRSMQASGKAKELEGKVKQQVAKVSARAKTAAERAGDGRTRVSPIGSTRMQSRRTSAESRRSVAR